MQPPQPASVDPLNSSSHPDAYCGAVLLSDQIEYYVKDFEPPLISHSDGSKLEDVELYGDNSCLDAASYKLRLGNEAHVGGVWVRISKDEPLVLPPHQVAIVKTYESINVPRFLVARWNLRVQWVYEGLLWVGGPQVDPGWGGELYCPIYNLAEREVVIPYMERVFTMDFTRTTPFHDDEATYGYKTNVVHKPARQKNIQGHDVNRLRSAPFEALGLLATLDTRFNSFITLTFLVLAVMIAAIGVVAALSGGGAQAVSQVIGGEGGLLVLLAVALVFGFSGLLISSITMASRLRQPPRGRGWLAALAIIGAVALGVGAGYAGVLLTSGPPEWSRWLKVLLWAVTGGAVSIGLVLLLLVWLRATRTAPIQGGS